MNRRKAISNIVTISIGAMVLPSCAQKDEAGLVKLKNISITGNEEKMLSQLSDAILPLKKLKEYPDNKPWEFALMMVDDCYEPEDQQKFISGLKAFDQLAKKKYGSSFTNCTAQQKLEWMNAIEKKNDIPDDVQYFYRTTKRHTIQAFTSSREYMTNVMKYKMVPGSNFKGCVSVVSIKN